MPASANDQLRLPLLRRIFRKGDVYLCGLCRGEHKSFGEANTCVNQCWFDVHKINPVRLNRVGPEAWTYRCLFCSRDYPSHDEALTCAAECLGTRTQKHIKEQLINELPLPPPTRPTSRLLMLLPQNTPAPQPAALPPAAKSKKDSGEIRLVKELPKGVHKSTFAKTWIRKGAKYECQYCKVQHYTKSEAISCFEGHFGEDGIEKLAQVSI